MLSSASKCPGVTDRSDVLSGVLIVVLIYNRTPFHFGVAHLLKQCRNADQNMMRKASLVSTEKFGSQDTR